VQKREERLLTRLDELGLRILTNTKPAAAAVARATPEAPGDAVDGMLGVRLEELSFQMDQFTQSVRTGLVGFLGEWAKLPPEVARVAADLHGLRQHLSTAATSTDALVSETRGLMEGLHATSSRMSEGLAATVGSVRHTVEGLGDDVQGVSDVLTRRMAGMEEANKRLASALDATSEQVTAASQRILAGVEAQGAAENAMKQLSASIADFGDRLSEIKDAQNALVPVLSQLAGPLELRLMPSVAATRAVPAGGDGQPGGGRPGR
jgi:hypothetical protein